MNILWLHTHNSNWAGGLTNILSGAIRCVEQHPRCQQSHALVMQHPLSSCLALHSSISCLSTCNGAARAQFVSLHGPAARPLYAMSLINELRFYKTDSDLYVCTVPTKSCWAQSARSVFAEAFPTCNLDRTTLYENHMEWLASDKPEFKFIVEAEGADQTYVQFAQVSFTLDGEVVRGIGMGYNTENLQRAALLACVRSRRVHIKETGSQDLEAVLGCRGVRPSQEAGPAPAAQETSPDKTSKNKRRGKIRSSTRRVRKPPSRTANAAGHRAQSVIAPASKLGARAQPMMKPRPSRRLKMFPHSR